MTMRTLGATTALALLALPALAQDETQVIGVSIPAATHGWAGGMNFHAQQAVERLEEAYPQLDFVLATAYQRADGPNGRANAIMVGQAKPLSNKDIKDLSAYLASLPGEMGSHR